MRVNKVTIFSVDMTEEEVGALMEFIGNATSDGIVNVTECDMDRAKEILGVCKLFYRAFDT